MTPTPRTPQQRDRRLARVRRVSRGVLVGSGLSSAALVGLFATTAKPALVSHVVNPTTTTTPSPTTSTSPTTTSPPTTVPTTSGGATPTTGPATTTTRPAPTTTTTVPTPTTTQPTCFTTPSGIQECS
jgi:hypothetical protein